MKAWMLCFLFASGLGAAQAAGPNFGAIIEKAERQTEHAHSRTMKSGTNSEAIGFYNNDWLNLRHRKRIAIAQVEVRLKKNQ